MNRLLLTLYLYIVLDFHRLSADYQQALLRQTVPFWLKNSRDEHFGGYFDCLTNTGQVLDSNKDITLQAQQAWVFAWLYNTLDGQPTWLEHATHGGSFLSQFAHSESIHTYGQVNRLGRPTAKATNLLSDSFTAMAYSQLYQATRADEWFMLAKQTFSKLLQRREAVHKQLAQTTSQQQLLLHLSEPIALLKATLELKPLVAEEDWKETIETVLHELLREFVDRRTDTLREHILPEGSFVNTPEGRRLNVGLTFQAVNFLLELSLESGNRKLAMQVTTWCLHMCEQGWNELSGGLNQYVDLKKQPLIFPDWSQKWAWVHVEALAALSKSYFQTRHPDCPKWLKRIHDFTFQFFPDSQHPGWHIALDQHNKPLMEIKATPSVGCYSLLRCLAETSQTLIKCGQLQPLGRNVRIT